MTQTTGNFAASSKDISGNYFLYCQSKDRQGQYQTARLGLNANIGNEDGVFKFGGKNFIGTSGDFKISDKGVLSGNARNRQQIFKSTTLDLNSQVTNNNGVLQFVSKDGNFAGSSKDIVGGLTLTCESKDRQGQYQTARLGLNANIGNEDGVFKFGGKNFIGTSGDFTINDKGVLSGNARNRQQSFKSTNLNLNSQVTNNNGVLQFVSKDGNFAGSSKDIVGGLTLTCESKDRQGNYQSTFINLDTCIGNEDGVLTWGGKNFSQSSANFSISDKGVLTCDCKNRQGNRKSSSLDLNGKITNNNGNLQYIG